MDYIISNCCNAFTINAGNQIICSNCSNVVATLKNSSNSSNSSSASSNTSNATSDIIIAQQFTANTDALPSSTSSSEHLLKRFSTDITCPIAPILCEKCKSPTRYVHISSPMFVCSNPKCRHINE